LRPQNKGKQFSGRGLAPDSTGGAYSTPISACWCGLPPPQQPHICYRPFGPHTGKPYWSHALFLLMAHWRKDHGTNHLQYSKYFSTATPVSLLFVGYLFLFHQVWPRLVLICIIGRSKITIPQLRLITL